MLWFVACAVQLCLNKMMWVADSEQRMTVLLRVYVCLVRQSGKRQVCWQMSQSSPASIVDPLESFISK